ncbi:tRNA modification GTPase TrmE [Buchnera aphidicola (Schlechtendalia chinensis)]|uniref:tRNA modification GTPase MnmE n=1 Tax=Buchnera aphidicola subsp. Schlechtendalia chinensis TaxID=118110 RepID=A0A172WD03_BUCSC|nr:tRNA uridine-5-carboxymethylaminomethyl(34) synthesis GTPase MnmE [Buchnera aphidicola]ANF16843.1 tRNA modification GTPase TrmE [Buchnera aphidicola (Schlechtendalia chinensis)]
MNCKNDTIVSRVTPEMRCNIGIIRVSGSLASIASIKILNKIPQPRYADYLPFLDNRGTIIDHGIALWFPSPFSFTGEDVLELQGHGNPVIINFLISNILSIPNIRLANPGEFSERAFLNGKIDLVQAESIVDLINSTSEKAVRAALQSLQGLFSSYIKKIVKKVIQFRTILETLINFSEDETNLNCEDDILGKIDEIIILLKNVFRISIQGNILRDGVKVVICGIPNSGKSSLLNALSHTNRSIVTNISGTTRDVIYECISIKGILFNLVDTAGLRSTNDVIERIGIKFAWKEINLADHILFVIDGSHGFYNQIESYNNFVKSCSKNANITIVFNKLDLKKFKVNVDHFKENNYFCVSAQTGEGIKTLREHLHKNFMLKNSINSNEGIFLARQRHINILEKVLYCMEFSKKEWKKSVNIELLAEDMRICQNELNSIVGSFTSDELLSNIFSNFCIGK